MLFKKIEEVRSVFTWIGNFKGCMAKNIPTCKNSTPPQSDLQMPNLFLFPFQQRLYPVTPCWHLVDPFLREVNMSDEREFDSGLSPAQSACIGASLRDQFAIELIVIRFASTFKLDSVFTGTGGLFTNIGWLRKHREEVRPKTINGQSRPEHWRFVLLLFLLCHHFEVFLPSGIGQFFVVRPYWSDVEVVEPIGTDFLFVELIKFGGDIIHVLLQFKPVFVCNHQIIPFLFGFDSPLAETKQDSVEFLS